MIKSCVNIVKSKKGMTLIEVILSIAILGIIAVMTLTVFSTGILIAINAGDNTLSTGNAVAKVNRDIVVKDAATTGPTQVTVTFPGWHSVLVTGSAIVTQSDNSTKTSSTMKAFVPVQVKVNP